MGMRSGLFPSQQQAQLLQQAHMARIHAQRHSQNQDHRINSRGSAMKLSSSIVREAKNQLKGLDPENMYIECPLCHKRIKRLYHFQRHMRIHSGEKSHQCPYCPYKSVRKDNLKSHLKTHEKHAMEARRNAEMLDKKRTSDFETIRRMQFNAMKSQLTSQLSSQMATATGAPPVSEATAAAAAAGTAPPRHHHHHPYVQHMKCSGSKCCDGPTEVMPTANAQPAKQATKATYDFTLKNEAEVTEITEIDSGCESPQEQASPMRQHCQSDTSGIESGQSERHSSKESDSSFSNGESPERIINVTK
jgi:DNA-directed RNA polymerase subunit RPC12/RpoP